jgi:hypothetical protein
MAGGVTPDHRTMKELWWMAEAHWEQVALLASLIAEPNRDHAKHPRPYTPDDFNRLVRRQEDEHPPNWIPYNEDILEAIVKSGKFGKSG